MKSFALFLAIGLAALSLSSAVFYYPPGKDENSGLSTIGVLGASVSYAFPDYNTDSVEVREALKLGYRVEVIDDEDWAKKTANEFRDQYAAIVISDNGVDFDDITAAIMSRDAWSEAANGNIVAMGTNPLAHAVLGLTPNIKKSARKVIANGIKFAVAVPDTTGAYIALGRRSPNVTNELMKGFGYFAFSEAKTDNMNIIHAGRKGEELFDGLTDADISNWHWSGHEEVSLVGPTNCICKRPVGFYKLAVGVNHAKPDHLNHSYYIARDALPSSGGSGAGGNDGDPHVRTLDGLTATYVNCGDQVMIRTNDNSVSYHARFCQRGNAASSTCAVAVRCTERGDVVEVYADLTGAKAFVGGREINSYHRGTIFGRDIEVSRRGSAVHLQCRCGTSFTVYLREASKLMYLDVDVLLDRRYFGRTEGLLGRWDGVEDNDIAYRDGDIWNSGHGLLYVNGVEYPTLAEIQASWTVRPSETLLRLSQQETNSVCQRGNERRMYLASRGHDTVLLEVAAKRCKEVGFSDVRLKTCVFDFIASNGDEAFIRNSLRHQ